MVRYTFSFAARLDLKEIIKSIAHDNPDAARKLKDKIKQKCDTLSRFPSMGRRRDELAPNLRSFPVDSYLIFYRVVETGIEIVRVVSGYRDLDQLFSE